MNTLQALYELGQSVWLDSISRSLVHSGELAEKVSLGLRGVTSNPSIFQKAISGSGDYDSQMAELAKQDLDTKSIYEGLAIADIQGAADVMRPLYDETKAGDGFVSLEVAPNLAHDTDGTLVEARRLWKAVDRPNLMIKVPATEEGIPVIEALIRDGINVNVTLIFSMDYYAKVMDAYVSGLEARAAAGEPVDRVASVASFFVSRLDGAMTPRLESAGKSELDGKVAVAHSKVAYEQFRNRFSGDAWEALASKGARVQRLLWASTSTKNPEWPKTLYVDPLVGADTVNTMPPETIEATLKQGKAENAVVEGLDEAKAVLEAVKAAGIRLEEVTDELLADGVKKFSASMDDLLASIEEKRAVVAGD